MDRCSDTSPFHIFPLGTLFEVEETRKMAAVRCFTDKPDTFMYRSYCD